MAMSLSTLDPETLELEADGPVLRVWLNRPQRRNAHGQQMLVELGDVFEALNTEFDVRVVVLAGRGLSFCAGHDRKEEPVTVDNEREQRYQAQLGRRATRAIERCEAVTVARVHGHAIGGGCCLALSCDFRVTTHDALWYVPEIELGVPLPWGATPRLISEIGAARAREMILTCERVEGARAAQWGLAHESVADEAALDAAVERRVARLLDMPVLSTHVAKTQLRAYSQLGLLGEVSEFDGDGSTLARTSQGARERMQKF